MPIRKYVRELSPAGRLKKNWDTFRGDTVNNYMLFSVI